MSKKEEKDSNPFKGFSVLNGPSLIPEQKDDDIIKTGADDVVVLDDESTKLGDEILEQNIKKAEELKKVKEKGEPAKAVKAEVVEDEVIEEEVEEVIEDKDVPVIKLFADNLFEKGVLDFNSEDKDFDGSEDGVTKLIGKTVENRINKWVDTLPDEFSKFLDYVKDGGKPRDFLDAYYGEDSWSDFKIETEDNQKEAIRQSLVLQGETYEDADDMINDWESSGKLQVRASAALEKLKKHEATQKELILKQQKEVAEQKKKAETEFWDNYKKDLYSKKEVMGFKLTEKLKNQLWDFISTPEKDGKTKYQKAVETNKDSSLLFALQAMQGFDISKLEKQVNTKVASKLADSLRNSGKDFTGAMNNGRNTKVDEPTNNVFQGFRNLI